MTSKNRGADGSAFLAAWNDSQTLAWQGQPGGLTGITESYMIMFKL